MKKILTIEVDSRLAADAIHSLRTLGIKNIAVRDTVSATNTPDNEATVNNDEVMEFLKYFYGSSTVLLQTLRTALEWPPIEDLVDITDLALANGCTNVRQIDPVVSHKDALSMIQSLLEHINPSFDGRLPNDGQAARH